MKSFTKLTLLFITLSFGTFGCKPYSFFSSETYQNLNSANLPDDVHLITSLNNYELSGTTTGYGNLRTDGIADFGLVLKSFTRPDLFQLELNDLMSTEFDKITVIGNDIELPSNVALPQQKERYILSINLNKPNYKVQFKEHEDQKLVLLHGQFPFDDVVKGFRNDQPLLKLANKFNIVSFSEYSFENPLSFSKFKLDLIAGQNIHSNFVQIQAPRTFPSDYSYVVVALDLVSNAYLANNLTVLAPNEIKNLKITANNTQIFSGLIHETFADPTSSSLLKHKMSLRLNSVNSPSTELLGFIENLSYKSDVLSYTLPNSRSLNEIGLAYNIFEIDQKNKETIIYQNFILGDWPNSLDLSFFEILRKPNLKYRIEVYLTAAEHIKNATNFDEIFEYAELVTRNTTNL
jgi:hypothetical protein